MENEQNIDAKIDELETLNFFIPSILPFDSKVKRKAFGSWIRAIDSLFKPFLISAYLSIVALILLPEILSMISVSNISLVNYTPYLFLNLVMSAGAVGLNTISAVEYIAASVTTIGIILLLVVLALSFNKIKKVEK